MDVEFEVKVLDVGEGKSFKSRLYKVFLELVFFDNYIKVIIVFNFIIFLLMMYFKIYIVLKVYFEL